MTKAQIGDLIRIFLNGKHLGKVYEVVEVLGEGNAVVSEADHRGAPYLFDVGTYEIHRKAGEEDSEKPCGKCASFAGTDNEGSFCSRECIERYQKRIADLADEIREPFRKYREEGEQDAKAEYPPGTTFSPNGLFPNESAQSDAVNQPSHYTQGKFETIEVIEEFTKGYDDGYVAYCVGNALKYEARAPFKHDTPLEDLRKAARYLAFAIDYLDAKSTQATE